jgi:hypothetical protein
MIAVEKDELDTWLWIPLPNEDSEIATSLGAFRTLGNAVEERRRGIGIGALIEGRWEGEFPAVGNDDGWDEQSACGVLTDRRLIMQRGLGVGSMSNSREA